MESVVRSIIVISLSEQIIIFVVVKVGTKFDCAQMWRGGTRRAGNQVFLMMLGRKIALCSLLYGWEKISPDVVTTTLKVFSINVYTLIDLGATLLFVTRLVGKKFYILPDILKNLLWCQPWWVSRWLQKEYIEIVLRCKPIELLLLN